VNVSLVDGGTLLAALVSAGYGLLSAVVPIANAEAYVVAAQAAGRSHGLLVAIAVAVGQTIGKAGLFLGVRHGRRSRFFNRRRADAPVRPPRPPRMPRLQRMIDRLLALVGSRWGVPITLLGSVVGVPPIYPLAMVAGATTMRLPLFCAAVLVGRCIRFGLLAFGVDAGITALLQLR
jgi:membrane protein YqaA with SNARE-associated domain